MILNQTRNGATLLITVLIVGTIALVISMSLMLRMIGELDMTRTEGDAKKALAIADSCLKEAFLGLWGDKSYALDAKKVEFADGSCQVTVKGLEEDHTVHVTATVGRSTRHISAHLNTAKPRLELLKWEFSTK